MFGSRRMTTAAVAGMALVTLVAAAPAPRLALTADQRAAVLTALDDERHAEAFYAAVIAKFGAVRPFPAILRAERIHQARLVELLAAASVAVPPNPYGVGGRAVPVPDTIAEACRAAVAAEVANAALYDEDLLPRVKDQPEVVTAFRHLSAASANNHLPAFQNCAAMPGRTAEADDDLDVGDVMPVLLNAVLAPIPW